LRKAIQERNFVYCGLFILSYAIAYYLFNTCGKNPGFHEKEIPTRIDLEARNTNNLSEPQGIELREDLSLQLRDSVEERRASLLSSQSSQTAAKSLYSSDSDDDESYNNRTGFIVAAPRGTRSPYTSIPEQRFCEVCGIIQPYRTKHCQMCERCVHKFDHHCAFIGIKFGNHQRIF